MENIKRPVELIDRDELIEVISRVPVDTREKIREVIMSMPAVLLAHEGKYLNDWKWDEKNERWYCPNCQVRLLPGSGRPNYCHNCGSNNQKSMRSWQLTWVSELL